LNALSLVGPDLIPAERNDDGIVVIRRWAEVPEHLNRLSAKALNSRLGQSPFQVCGVPW
jgi:hypothetical protein